MHYQWQGNVRELKNFMERLVIMTDSDEIEMKEVLNILPESFSHQFAPLQHKDDFHSDEASLRDRLDFFERQLLMREFNLIFLLISTNLIQNRIPKMLME